MIVIGIDCATQPKSTGLALAELAPGRRVLREVTRASQQNRPAAIVQRWLGDVRQGLLAIDAPLGWPRALGPALAAHEAGEFLSGHPDQLFHRATDDVIRQRFAKRPLEVGANLIARTARAALALIHELSEALDRPIPLSWKPSDISGLAVIEVYPAATCLGRSRDPLAIIASEFETANTLSALQQSADVRDAALCALAGFDYLQGRCPPPSDLSLARHEGWIWAAEA